MKGRQLLIGSAENGRNLAALMIDGRLQDLLVDPSFPVPTAPEAIHCGIVARPMKGLGGTMLNLGAGTTGYLRGTRTPPAGQPVLVQITGWPEDGKAPTVSSRLRLKGRFVILTPGAPGINVSRTIRDPDRRSQLEQLGRMTMEAAPETAGLILRTTAGQSGEAEVKNEIDLLLRQLTDLQAGLASGEAGCLLAAPSAVEIARREWGDPDTLISGHIALSDLQDALAALESPIVPLGEGFMSIEATRALVAVDVNTGGDTSSAAGLKATIAALRELPRQLRLRGLGGQITVDPAPFPRKHRKQVETVVAGAFRTDDVETNFAGWTPLGHIELQRKRSRRPLKSEDFQIAAE